ncbi:MAG: hypothetical protein ACRC14_06465 [Paracoccaceae bacterium]
MLDRSQDFDPQHADQATDLIACARRESPASALMSFCRHLTGQSGFLILDGHVLCEQVETAPLIAATGRAVARKGGDLLVDAALAQMGLALMRVRDTTGTPAAPARLEAAVVALRLGFLGATLDRAFRHLEGREVFGQKLLHHQLIKTAFSRAQGVMVQIAGELRQAGNDLSPAIARVQHNRITVCFTQSAKLMGGHGFLAAGLHAQEHLSGLVRAVYGPRTGGYGQGALRSWG